MAVKQGQYGPDPIYADVVQGDREPPAAITNIEFGLGLDLSLTWAGPPASDLEAYLIYVSDSELTDVTNLEPEIQVPLNPC